MGKEIKKVFFFEKEEMEIPSSVEKICKVWKSHRDDNLSHIKTILLESPKTLSLLVDKDPGCEAECLTREDYQHVKKKCKGCQILSNLYHKYKAEGKVPLYVKKEYDEEGADVAYDERVLEMDFYDKKDYAVSSKHHCTHKFEYRKDPEMLAFVNIIEYKIRDMYSEDNNNTDFSYSTKCPELNYILISCLMTYTMDRKSFLHFPPYLWSYLCGDDINIISKCGNIGSGTLSELKNKGKSPISKGGVGKQLSKDKVVLIIKELTCLIKFLTNYGFNHGCPSIEYLHFENSETVCSYDDLDFSGKIKVIIEPSCYSSMSIKIGEKHHGFRCMAGISEFSNTIPVEKITPQLFHEELSEEDQERFKSFKTPLEKEYLQRKVLCYFIGNKGMEFLNITKMNGVSVFGQSFNFVCFLLSLMKDKEFYTSFMDNRKLEKIWNGMWRKKDLEYITENIHDKYPNNFDTIFGIIKNVYIRTDALLYFFNRLKTDIE